jgi:dynein light intermediate chain
MSFAANSLLKLDPAVSADSVRRPRALKLQPSKNSSNVAAGGIGPSNKGRTVPPVDDILHAILPPTVVSDANAPGPSSVRCVSTQQATRLDLVRLQETLDDSLDARQARESGVCPVRSELYLQALDELIRQVTLECPERGLLLLRVRDELRTTTAAYRSVYTKSVAFGSRKALAADAGTADLKAAILRLDKDKLGLEVRVLELQAKCEATETAAQAQRTVDEKLHAEEVNFYRKTNHQLASQLKTETDKANVKK